jgi:hypothetical protein
MKNAYVVAALIAAASIPAQAQEAASLPYTFGGFGTLGFASSNNGEADYLVDAFRPKGPGHTRRTMPDPDTRVGLQATFQPASALTVVLQVTAEQREDDSFRPRIEWANLKWQVNPDLAIRAGRTVLPVFMVTDSRRVGYAIPWVRPPVEMYALVPVTHNDGVEALWRTTFGAVTNTLQFNAGRSDSKFPSASGFEAGTAEARRLLAVNDTVEIGFLSLRATYGKARLTIAAFEPLDVALRMFGPPGIELADRYGIDDKEVSFVGVGAAYDPGQWFVMGEAAKFDTNSIVGAKKAWYVSAGYRFGKFTPYATYARTQADSETSTPGLPVAFLPPEVQPTAAFLNATLNQQLNILPRQKTLSAGVRWDFYRNLALKLQYDQVDVDPGSFGTFGNIQPGFQPGSRVRILNATLDFVF